MRGTFLDKQYNRLKILCDRYGRDGMLLASVGVDWTISRLPGDARALVHRYGLYALTRLGLRQVPVVRLRGVTRTSNRPGTLLVAGHDPWVRYLPSRFFLGDPQRELVDNVSESDLPALIHRLRGSADLTIVRADQLSAQKCFEKDYLMVPEWVGMRIAVPQDVGEFVRGVRSIWEDMRVIRRNRLRPLISQSKTDFDAFYNTVYVPYIRGRHKESAFLASKRFLYWRFTRGGILWVIQGDQRLAAGLFERRGETIHFWAIGAVNGDEALMKQRAFTAVYYFLLQYARENGCAHIDLRGVRPSLYDGLFRYKRKWGGTIYDKRDGTYHDLLLHWDPQNRVVKEFLSHTPLVFRDHGGLSALHTDSSQSRRELWIDGLRDVYVLDADGPRPMEQA